MKREIFKTEDGSVSIRLPEWDEQYHSIHGAIQESQHVFIKSGLAYYRKNLQADKPGIDVLEIGFGTGLNAFLSLIYAQNHDLKINYTGLEAYPISTEEHKQLNYAQQIGGLETKELFEKLFQAKWGQFIPISDFFNVHKKEIFIQDFEEKDRFDLIYFDAFGAQVQPELWEESIFEKMFSALHKKGVLVTYSAKGSVRRALKKVGFEVERIPGPPGKREMLRAIRVD